MDADTMAGYVARIRRNGVQAGEAAAHGDQSGQSFAREDARRTAHNAGLSISEREAIFGEGYREGRGSMPVMYSGRA